MAIAERRLQAEYEHIRDRRRRVRQVVAGLLLALLAVAVAVLAALGELPGLSLSPEPPEPPTDALFANFGLSRSTITREKVVTYTEGSRPAQGESSTSNVVTAMLATDLRDQGTEKQFSASQVQVSASPIAPGRLQLSAIINPTEPQEASGGTYRGTVQVFTANRVIDVPILLYLAPRDGGRAGVALLLLVVGASLGLAVKWITESLSKLAVARWRLEDLRRSLGGDPSTLPLMAAVYLEEIEDRIRRQDTDDLEEAFDPLRVNVLNLRSFAAAVRAAEDEIERQHGIAEALEYRPDGGGEGLDPDFVDGIARMESTRVERFRALDWPWKDPEVVVHQVQALADQCSTASNAMNDVLGGRRPQYSLKVLECFRKGEFETAVELYRDAPYAPDDEPPPDEESGAKRTGRSIRSFGIPTPPAFLQFRRPGQQGLVSWMAQRPRWFAGAASVFVVSLVGLQLQYLDVDDFSGRLGDWLGLLLWAAVVELSGVSVLDVLSRLGR